MLAARVVRFAGLLAAGLRCYQIERRQQQEQRRACQWKVFQQVWRRLWLRLQRGLNLWSQQGWLCLWQAETKQTV